MHEEQERAAFEAWYCADAERQGMALMSDGIANLRDSDGGYGGHRAMLNGKWEGWQARASLAKPQPVGGALTFDQWWLSLPEGRRVVLSGDKLMFAEAAYNAGLATLSAPAAQPGEAAPDAWSYENMHGNVFLCKANPNDWHPHDKACFQNFKPLFYAATPQAAAVPAVKITQKLFEDEVRLVEAAVPEAERERLRAEQSANVMPQIGPLLDAWDGLYNDMKATILEEAPNLARSLEAIGRAMEGLAAPEAGAGGDLQTAVLAIANKCVSMQQAYEAGASDKGETTNEE